MEKTRLCSLNKKRLARSFGICLFYRRASRLNVLWIFLCKTGASWNIAAIIVTQICTILQLQNTARIQYFYFFGLWILHALHLHSARELYISFVDWTFTALPHPCILKSLIRGCTFCWGKFRGIYKRKNI